MATPITKSIGTTGRDYSTLTAFEAAIPADLTATDETWTGECYNDSEFSERLSIDGHTTDATRWIKVTTAAGESFMDHADKLTNALAYDQSKGVGITNTGGYQHTVELKDGYTTFEKIQIKRPSGGGSNSALHNDVSNVTAQNLIIHQLDNATAVRVQGTSKLINSVIITEATSAVGVLLVLSGSAYNVASVSPSDITNTSAGFQRSYGSPIALNCASFGFNTGFNGYASFSASSGYNATDNANAPGSNNQVSKTFTAQFETVTTTGMDFRAKSGSDLESNGTRDQTNTADLDIIGQDRDTSTPTIGAWEFIAAGFASLRQTLINGLTSAQSEATGWNAEVRDKMPVSAVVRTDDNTVTITLPPAPAFDITAQEVITQTIAAALLQNSTEDIIAGNTVTVDFVISGETFSFNVGDFSIVGNQFILSEQFNFNTPVGQILGKIMATGEGISFGPGADVYFASPLSLEEGVAFSAGVATAVGEAFSIEEGVNFGITGGIVSSPFALAEGVEMASGDANVTSFPFILSEGNSIGFSLGADAIVGEAFTVQELGSVSFSMANGVIVGNGFTLSAGNSVAFSVSVDQITGEPMSVAEAVNFLQSVNESSGVSFSVSESEIIEMNVSADGTDGLPFVTLSPVSMSVCADGIEGLPFLVTASNDVEFNVGQDVQQGLDFAVDDQINFAQTGQYVGYAFSAVNGGITPIEGQLSYVIDINGGSVQLYYNGDGEYFVIDSTTEV